MAGWVVTLLTLLSSLLTTVINLVTYLSIRGSEELLERPALALTANLSLANIIHSILVSLVSAILGGYAVSLGRPTVQMEFCGLWRAGRAATRAVLPATVVMHCFSLSSKLHCI